MIARGERRPWDLGMGMVKMRLGWNKRGKQQ